MPTISSGNITPGTGQVTFPNATDTTGIASSDNSNENHQGNNIVSIGGINLGSGEGIYAGTSGKNALLLDFRTIIAGAGIAINTDAETLTITSTGTISSNLNDLNGVLSVQKGGTGTQNFLAGALVVGNGISAMGTIPLPTSANQYLSWNGTAYTWNTIADSADGTVTSVAIVPGSSGYISISGSPITSSGTITVDFNIGALSLNGINGTLGVTKGGTGVTTLPMNGVMYGNGTGAVQTVAAPSSAGQVLSFNGTTFAWVTPQIVPSNVLTSVVLNGNTVTGVTGGTVSANSVTYNLVAQPSGVTAGTYVNANIQVDQYGRVVSATNGAVQAAITAANENNGGGARIFDDIGSTSTAFNFRRIQTSTALSATENTGYVMLDLNTVQVPKGGTGATTFTTNGVLIGNGTNAISAIAAPSTVGTVLTWTSNGFAWNSSLQKVTITGSNGINVTQGVDTNGQPTFALDYDSSQTVINGLSGTLNVTKGGTGATTFPANSVLLGNGTGTLATTPAPTTANTTLVWNGTGFVWNAFPNGSISSFTIAGDSSILVTNGAVTSSNSTVTIGVATSGVTAGTYSNSTITVDKTGRITAAANGVLPVTGAANYVGGAAIYDNTASGSTLNFRPIKVGSAALTVTQNAQDVTLDIGNVPVSKGGTGATTFTANGLLVGNGANAITSLAAPTTAGTFLGWNGTTLGYTPALTAVTVTGSGAAVVNSGTDANGQPTYALSVDSTKIPANNLNGTLNVPAGGTGLTTVAANAIVMGGTSTALNTITVPTTAGTMLTWNGSAFTWTAPPTQNPGTVTSVGLTNGGGIIVTGGPITSNGSITVAVDQPALDLNTFAGTLTVTKGGTGSSTFTANGLLLGNGTGAFAQVAAPSTANTYLSWNGTAYTWLNDVTTNGTVTSVAVSAGSNKLSVSGSPITSSGTITVDVVEANLQLSNLSGILPTTSGGTGLSTIGTAGQILAVNSTATGLVWQNANQTGGTVTSVAVTGASGRVAVTGSPITSSGTINVDVVESGLNLASMGGTLTTSQGGTGLTSIGTAGQVLTVNSTATALQWSTPFSAVNAGSNKVTVSTVGGVATVDVNTANMDVSTMLGILGTAHGGTGIATIGTAGQVLAVNSSGTGLTWNNPAVGSGGGTVTSVAVAAGSTKVTVSGSPITSSGTITVDVDTTKMDISTMTGTLGVANGGTGATTLTGLVYGNGTSAMTAATGSQIATALGTTNISGNAANVTGTIATSNGGTGLTTIGTAGQVLAVNSGATGLTWTTPATGTVTSVGIVAGSTKVSVSGGPVTTTGNITVDVNTANMDVSTMTGTLGVAHGGTGVATLTGLVYGNGTLAMTAATGAQIASALGTTNISGNAANVTGTVATSNGGTGLTSIGTAGQVLTVNAGATGLTWSTPTTGTVTSVNLAAGSNKVTVSGGPITSSGSITVDVNTANMDVSTMTGTLDTAHGGTGLTTIGTANQVLAVNSGATGLTWTNAGTGTVTSVGLTAGSNKVTVSGSPVTSSGSITVDVNTANMDVSTMTGTLAATHGGTGLATTTTNGVLIGAASNTITQVAAPTASGQVLTYNGTNVDWAAAAGGGPAGSTSPGWYTFQVTLNATGSATASITNLPSGWSAVDGGSGVLTVTHTVGKYPTSLTMFGSASATAGPFKVRNADQSSTGGSFQIPDSGSFTPSTTQFNVTVTSATSGAAAAGIVLIKVTF
jgi:hypothetical protein